MSTEPWSTPSTSTRSAGTVRSPTSARRSRSGAATARSAWAAINSFPSWEARRSKKRVRRPPTAPRKRALRATARRDRTAARRREAGRGPDRARSRGDPRQFRRGGPGPPPHRGSRVSARRSATSPPPTTSKRASRIPDLIEAALAKASYEAATVIGDSVWDVEAASRAGARERGPAHRGLRPGRSCSRPAPSQSSRTRQNSPISSAARPSAEAAARRATAP